MRGFGDSGSPLTQLSEWFFFAKGRLMTCRLQGPGALGLKTFLLSLLLFGMAHFVMEGDGVKASGMLVRADAIAA